MDGHESDSSGDEERRRGAMCVAASLMLVDSATQTEQEEVEFETLHEGLDSAAILAEPAIESHGESDDLFGIGSPFGIASSGVEESIRGSLMNTCVREAEKLLPGPGRGRSEANAAASNVRRDLQYPDGIYEAWCLESPCPFQRNTGFGRNEVDDFYTAQGGDEKAISSECQGTSTGSSRQPRTMRDVGSREHCATATVYCCVGS
ncbi:unnamed protein product [Ectocarpus sp. 4 AP-2014]